MFGLMITFGSIFQGLAMGLLADEQPQATGAVTEVDPPALDTKPDDSSADVIESGKGNDQETNSNPLPMYVRLQASFLGNACALIATLMWMRLMFGIQPSHLGLIPSRIDLRRGLVATIWILTPVLLVNFLVSLWVEYDHAVMNLLAEEKGFITFLSMLVSAAGLTPIFEELLFRGLLQGGLQRVADLNAYDDSRTTWSPRSVWPIVVTSVVFAYMHFGQGAAPIPLYLLSIGLGFLYQAHGSLVPCIIVHFLLNATTLLMEYCRANAGFGPS
ncbi:MAG: CPBP family intramembrane glutamic endopeptidase [Planctomycetota bacterium]